MIKIHDYKEGITYWSSGGENIEDELSFNILMDTVEQMKKDNDLREKYLEEHKKRFIENNFD